MQLIKCKEHPEIFKITGKIKYWIENWDTFVFIAKQMGITWNELLVEVETIPFEELRDNYPVGETMLKKTVTTIVGGKKPREIFYPETPPVTIRKLAILGTCLGGCVDMWKNLGGNRFYGNRFPWPHPETVEEAGMKIFINPHKEYGTSEAEIKRMVLDWRNREGCGGYWSDEAGGHEPDITGPNLEARIKFYNTVRKYDPDKQGHPVMEMFDMTLAFNGYPGWEGAFSDATHDLLLFDCYPPAEWTDEEAIAGMENAWKTMISVFPHVHQVVPQINACSYRPGFIKLQYNFWNEKMSSDEFDNPYRGPISLCYYKDEYIRRNPEMQNEIREVNEEIMRQEEVEK